jgi:hypothetical protein
MFENTVLRILFGPKERRTEDREEVGENCIMRSFIACTLLKV